MGSGSSARYATKKENVESAAKEELTLLEKPTASNARTVAYGSEIGPNKVGPAWHQEDTLRLVERVEDPQNNVSEVRVTAPTKRSPRTPAQQETRELTVDLQGMQRQSSGRPPSGRPGSRPASGTGNARPVSRGHRASLGQTLQHLERTQSPARSPGLPSARSSGNQGEAADAIEASDPAAAAARRRASWALEPPPPPGPSAAEVIDELSDKYPTREYEMTAFACLPGMRPGLVFTLGGCEEQPTLNGLSGLCKDYDSDHHVWVLHFDDSRWMRVIPLEVRDALPTSDGEQRKCVKCAIAYGEDVGTLLIDREMHQKKFFDGPAPKPRKPKPAAVAVAEPTPIDEPEPAKPAAVPRRPVSQPDVVVSIEVPEVEDYLSHGYRAGDLVTFMEARGLGVGKVVGNGKAEGEVLVQFGKGSHIYSLESAHLEKVKKKEVKRRRSVR